MTDGLVSQRIVRRAPARGPKSLRSVATGVPRGTWARLCSRFGGAPGPWEHMAHNPGELVMNCRHRMKDPELETPLVLLLHAGRRDVRYGGRLEHPAACLCTQRLVCGELPLIRDSEHYEVMDRIICESLDASWGAAGGYRGSASSPAAGVHGSTADAPLAKTRAPSQVSHPMETHDAR